MIVTFASIQCLTVAQACDVIRNQQKKRVNDLRIFDLIEQNDEALPFVHGLYMFFDSDGKSCLYVGRVMSPQFIERIPAHFAISEASWQNQFLKAHKEHNDCPSFRAAAVSAKDCQILILPMPHEFIVVGEKLFILFLKPKYNKRRPSADYYGKIPIDIAVSSAMQVFQT